MKLYYSRAACSMAPHIALRELGLNFELIAVDLRDKKTATGEDFIKINPKGYVPALRLDNGELLTEAGVILQYLADQKPQARLAPPPGTLERYQLMEWLNFIATEVHKTLGALFKSYITPEWKESSLTNFAKQCDFIAAQLAAKPYLMGEQYGIADIYLYTILSWTRYLKVDMSQWPTLQNYMHRIGERTAVREMLKAEGLVK